MRCSLPLLRAASRAPLRFNAAGCCIPHPSKAEKGGEDAFLVSEEGRVCAVFDGVGGWAEVGVDAGLYSKALASGCQRRWEEWVEREAWEGGGESDVEDMEPTALMRAAWLDVGAQGVVGSSTACLLMLEESGSKLKSANLGDSAYMVVRDGVVLHREEEQTHAFNFPYQIGSDSSDHPEVANVRELEVEEGDLFVVGTDGLWDNLFDEDVLDLVLGRFESGGSVQEVANAVAAAAFATGSLESGITTPFGTAAHSMGYTGWSGGKLDDTTVVIARLEQEVEE